ncbi:MAG TPA: hypothetical protein VGZ29_07800 [Terriglobia bacterium]|nr:hypothetical protein [Terriglobia bacterium]
MLKVSRRGFARRAAAVVAISLSPASSLLSADSGSEPQTLAGIPAEDTKLGMTFEQIRRADARLANVVREFEDRLSDQQRQRIRRILLYNEKMLSSVRSFHLENADPPASVLKCGGDGEAA